MSPDTNLEWQGRRSGRNLLDIPHLNRAPLPSGQYLLDPLAKKSISLSDPVATPPEEKIQLNGSTLHIRAIMLFEGRDLGRETDAILANLAPQLVQGKLLDLFRAT